MLRTRARWKRGAALGFFALVDFSYFIYLLDPPTPLSPSLIWPARVMPLQAWACVWGVVGLLCLAYAFVDRDAGGYVAAVAVKVCWGLISLFGWMAGVNRYGWLAAVFWLVFAVFVYLIAGGIPRPAPRART